jgi:tRNA threonylcarbamoyl adenosine modification protein YeaZ
VTNYGLAIHTASAALGLAINNFAGDRRDRVWELGRETSNLLHQYLLEFIQPQTWQDLSFLAVAKGPGGFTGTRIGVVAARTLAQQLDLPLFAVSTLAGVAWQTAKSLPDPTIAIAVQMRAQRDEVFGAIYQLEQADTENSQLVCRLPDTAMAIADWQKILDEWETPYQAAIAADGIAATVVEILELAHCDWQHGHRPHWLDALPYYGQHPVDR